MRGQTITQEITMVVEECYKCGVPFAISNEFKNDHLKTHDNFYCPNGHGQRYGENESERQIRQLKKEVEYANEDKKYWRNEAETKARSLSATKGALTKTKKRIANGVCPCCHRSFLNVIMHMETEHPDYGKAESCET